MKVFHNKFIGKLVAVVLGVGIALYFAWNFYYFGYWMGEHFLTTVPYGQFFSGYGVAAIMFLAVLLGFFYREYLREDIEAFEAERGDGSYIRAFGALVWVIFGLEFFSVLFRWYILNLSQVGFILLGVGVALMLLEYLIGKVLHAQANAPAVAQAARVMDMAGQQLWGDAPKHLKKMNPAQLRRIAAGDPQPLDEVAIDIMGDRRSDEMRADETKRKKEGRWGRARTMAANFLRPSDDDAPFPSAHANQADSVSQNGHRN